MAIRIDSDAADFTENASVDSSAIKPTSQIRIGSSVTYCFLSTVSFTPSDSALRSLCPARRPSLDARRMCKF